MPDAIINEAGKLLKPDKPLVFISYSHEDRRFFDELRKQLIVLERKTSFSFWDDTQIVASEKWKQKINDSLNKAKIAILLISPSFFSSNFIYDVEFKPLIEKAMENDVRILWVYVDHVDYIGFGIGEFQAVTLPKKGLKPLSGMRPADRNALYVKVIETIKAILGC